MHYCTRQEAFSSLASLDLKGAISRGFSGVATTCVGKLTSAGGRAQPWQGIVFGPDSACLEHFWMRVCRDALRDLIRRVPASAV